MIWFFILGLLMTIWGIYCLFHFDKCEDPMGNAALFMNFIYAFGGGLALLMVTIIHWITK